LLASDALKEVHENLATETRTSLAQATANAAKTAANARIPVCSTAHLKDLASAAARVFGLGPGNEAGRYVQRIGHYVRAVGPDSGAPGRDAQRGRDLEYPGPAIIRPLKDKRGVDLISDALPCGGLWYAGSTAVVNAIGYAEHRIRSHDAVIRVYDAAGNDRMRI
jgi:hypothetical protein